MNITRVPSPKQFDNGDYDPVDSAPPDNYAGADEVIYWYSVGSYCGAGHALIFKNGKVALIGLSHCSCYGPWEGEPREYLDRIEVSPGLMAELEVFNRPDLFHVV